MKTTTKTTTTVKASSSNSKKNVQVYSKGTNSNDFVMLPDGSLVPAREYKELMRDRW